MAFEALCSVAATNYERLLEQDASALHGQDTDKCSVASTTNERLLQQPAPALHGGDTIAHKRRVARYALKSYVKTKIMPHPESIELEEDIDFKSIPNRLITELIEYSSDELRKKFSFKCLYSPCSCSEVQESYGNEEKAFYEIKKHVVKHHCLEEIISLNVERAVKRLYWVHKKKLNEGKLIFQEPTAETDTEEKILVQLRTYFEARGLSHHNDILNTIKLGEFEHTYAKRPDKLSKAIPSLRGAVQKKNRQQNIEPLDNNCDVNRCVNSDSLLQGRIIYTPGFPFVYESFPLETVYVVELDSNGDQVDVKELAFPHPSTSRISSKKAADNKMIRKKSKFILAVDSPRSILECVENRVSCKSNASSEQNNALLTDDSIENSENIESMREIAMRHLRLLREQKKKRKYRDKPTNYVCKICSKRVTANTTLIYHYMGHLGIKPFKCNICLKSFTRRHSLKYHIMIHNNQNRFECPICFKLFRHPSHFKEHMRKHTGEEPFSCQFCSNKFKTRNSFKRHLKMQHQKLLTSNGIVPIVNEPERN